MSSNIITFGAVLFSDYPEYQDDNYEDEAAVYDENLVKKEEEQNGNQRAYAADDY